MFVQQAKKETKKMKLIPHHLQHHPNVFENPNIPSLHTIHNREKHNAPKSLAYNRIPKTLEKKSPSCCKYCLAKPTSS